MNVALAGKTCKSVLNELYQKEIRAPKYETKQDSSLPGTSFTCEVDLPAIVGAFVGAKFKGTAKSKKVAEQTAADNALRYIHDKAQWILLGKTAFGFSPRGPSDAAATENQVC